MKNEACILLTYHLQMVFLQGCK